MLKSEKKKIVIIGAGMGGLATAIRLAVAGCSVEVFEKNERTGGKLNLLEKGGFRWDTGPSLVTMPFVYRELFAMAGRKLEDYAKLIPIEPICRYFYPDAQNTIFETSDSISKMTAEIEKLEPHDVAAYFRFMAYSRRLYDLTAEVFLFQGLNALRDLRQLDPRDMFKIDPFRTVHQAVAASFKDPRLVQLFDRYATYNGSSPYLAPATLNIIPYVELGMGGWYVQGGLYALAQAYQKLAEELGVTIHTGPEWAVERIVTNGRQVQAVQLKSGATVAADIIVANTDAAYTYSHLLKEKVNQSRWSKLEPSCSGFVLFLGLNRQYSQLTHHNILFSRDYRREFATIFEDKVPSLDPTIYICWTGKTDPEHAPPGKSNLFVLVNAPYLSDAFDWAKPKAIQTYRNLIVNRMEEFGLTDLNSAIELEYTMTPLDLAQRYNAERGAIYGLSSNNRFSAFLRPPNRAKGVDGLYFVGGSTHPGGGIPLVTLSARIVAGLIAEDS
ncbi:MAG: phytoene desaturase family protein [Chloroflexota bacterium]